MTIHQFRLDFGQAKYGHGLLVDEDVRKYGVVDNDWRLMALEEMLDMYNYLASHYLRKTGKTGDCNHLIKNMFESEKDSGVCCMCEGEEGCVSGLCCKQRVWCLTMAIEMMEEYISQRSSR